MASVAPRGTGGINETSFHPEPQRIHGTGRQARCQASDWRSVPICGPIVKAHGMVALQYRPRRYAPEVQPPPHRLVQPTNRQANDRTTPAHQGQGDV